jgi:hypothetical protein
VPQLDLILLVDILATPQRLRSLCEQVLAATAGATIDPTVTDALRDEVRQFSRRVALFLERLARSVSSGISPTHRAEALFAWVAAVEHQLDDLILGAHELPRWFWPTSATIHQINDFVALVRRQVEHVRVGIDAIMIGSPESRVQLRTVEQCASAIGRDPDVACFLAVGASMRSERFQRASRTLAALLGLALVPCDEDTLLA